MEKNFGNIVFYIRRPVDRRRFKNGHLLLKQEDLGHNPVRRGNIIGRRMIRERRRLLPEIMDTLWEKVL
jgi:hypothetical protein